MFWCESLFFTISIIFRLLSLEKTKNHKDTIVIIVAVKRVSNKLAKPDKSKNVLIKKVPVAEIRIVATIGKKIWRPKYLNEKAACLRAQLI